MKNSENTDYVCIVFPMGMEQFPFLQRLEVRKRWRSGHAVYREAYFEGRTILVVRCGIGPEKAAAAIRKLATKPKAVLSAGTAGGLVPTLERTHLVVSSETVYGHDPASILHCDEDLVRDVSRACTLESCSMSVARLATVREAVFPQEDRKRLHVETGALAVDMESHAIGIEACRLDVPFVSLRVISDDFHSHPLPGIRETRIQWNAPCSLPGVLRAKWHRHLFLRRFASSIEILHPVLVRIVRQICPPPRLSG
ncbi:hypothetical protein [Desulfomonile tiedjei]|uniref:5'-methylthioadenosine/S-adenosylhomocysteine nucleosidase family protein n=1 Tax=Desulfomonile tiedjei TaxID=2358 RepID=UPI0012F908D9|nr:hypothetical protein [Desulfomonile tiedjei]